MLEVSNIEDGDLLGNIAMGPDGGIIATPGLAEALVRGWRLHGFEDKTIYEQLLPGYSNGYYEVVPGMPDAAPEPDLAKADAPTPDLADQVHAQLEPDYPAEALDWVRKAKWSGPAPVPLDQVDFSGQDTWRAAHEDKRVNKTVKRLAKGKPVKPVVLVNEPGAKQMIVADGHHRALGYQRANQPIVAYVAHVASTKGPWSTMHAQQQDDGK